MHENTPSAAQTTSIQTSLDAESPTQANARVESQAPISESLVLPVEVLRLIFRAAAKSNQGCAYSLALVSRTVYIWVQPILYERVIIRNFDACYQLLKTLRSTGSQYSKKIKSFMFDCDEEAGQVGEPIFAEFAKDITFLSIYEHASLGWLMQSLEAPNLERLALVQKSAVFKSRSRIPLLFTSTKLTHVLAVAGEQALPLKGALHITLSQITGIPWLGFLRISSRPAFKTALDNLTHVAVTTSAAKLEMGDLYLTGKACPNLKYLALLESVDTEIAHHNRLIAEIKSSDHYRFVVVMKDLGSPGMWGGEDASQDEFWTKVENLVDEGYLSDRGDRWD